MVWVSRDGALEAIAAPPRRYSEPTVSPGGRRIAVTIDDDSGGTDVWIWDERDRTLGPLTSDPSIDMWPLWTPDGREVIFLSSRDRGGLYRKAPGRQADARRIMRTSRGPAPYSWTRDGRLVLTVPKAGSARRDIALLGLDDDGSLENLLDAGAHEQRPAVSPDGRWLAYGSRETGRDEIYVRPFPDVARERWRASPDGGKMSRWSPDGGELFFLSATALMAAGVESGGTLRIAQPIALVPLTGLLGVGVYRHYDVAPDGRFLFLAPAR